MLKFDLHGLVETRLRTFFEFTFAHIYHLRTKKYYVCALLEINVCAHSLLKTSLFVSLLLMHIIFSSWLENTSYWFRISFVFSLDFGNFGGVFHRLLYVHCLTDLTSPDKRSVVSCFAISVIIILFGLSYDALSLHYCTKIIPDYELMQLWIHDIMSLNRPLIWFRTVMLEWQSNIIKSLRSVVHVALHSFLMHRHVLDDFASLWILY